MMRRIALATALVALVGWVAPASAQVRTFSLGVAGGLSVPMGDLSDAASSGFEVAALIYLRPARFTNLGFRGDISYDRWGLKNGADGKASAMGFAANAVFNVPTSGSTVRPYVLAGPGYYSTKSSVTIGSTTINSPTNSDFGFQAGAGMGFQLSGFSTFLEARYVKVMVDEGSYAFLPVTFGLRF